MNLGLGQGVRPTAENADGGGGSATANEPAALKRALADLQSLQERIANEPATTAVTSDQGSAGATDEDADADENTNPDDADTDQVGSAQGPGPGASASSSWVRLDGRLDALSSGRAVDPAVVAAELFGVWNWKRRLVHNGASTTEWISGDGRSGLLEGVLRWFPVRQRPALRIKVGRRVTDNDPLRSWVHVLADVLDLRLVVIGPDFAYDEGNPTEDRFCRYIIVQGDQFHVTNPWRQTPLTLDAERLKDLIHRESRDPVTGKRVRILVPVEEQIRLLGLMIDTWALPGGTKLPTWPALLRLDISPAVVFRLYEILLADRLIRPGGHGGHEVVRRGGFDQCGGVARRGAVARRPAAGAARGDRRLASDAPE